MRKHKKQLKLYKQIKTKALRKKRGILHFAPLIKACPLARLRCRRGVRRILNKFQILNFKFQTRVLWTKLKIAGFYSPLLRGRLRGGGVFNKLKVQISNIKSNPKFQISNKFPILYLKHPNYPHYLKNLKKHSRPLITLLLLFSLLTSLLFLNRSPHQFAQGATYYFTQTDWSGGASTTATAVHPTDQNNYTKYYSKDSNISASSSLSLTTFASSTTQTTDAHFNTGTKASTTVSSNSVALATSTIIATGGTITYSGGYTIHTFISSGTFTFTGSGNVEVLVVAGGGGGGGTGSGGGAGGYVYNSNFPITSGTYSVTVGNGGSGGSNAPTNGTKGNNSVFSTITAEGGGAGISHGGGAGGNGGSGGGGSIVQTGGTPAGGTGSQGNAGGAGYVISSWVGNSGGGGGAGAVGTAGGNSAGSGKGGNGLPNSISGTSVIYAGGGGGGEVSGSYVGAGGTGGGGNANMDSAGSSGTANTGGGGGGGSFDGSVFPYYYAGGNGGSGIVIVRYLVSSYYSSGTFTSGIINIGPNNSWGNLSWTKTGTGTITMKARSCDDAACSGEPAFSSCSNITSGSALSTGGCVTNGHQYVQYEASLSTADTTVTPSLDDVTIRYNTSPSSLTSSKYDSSSSGNALAGIKWTEDASLPSGTSVTISLRASSTAVLLDTTNWVGLTNSSSGCSKAGTLVTCTSAALSSWLTDATGDQYLQYKTTLTSTGTNTATVDNIIVTYVVNAPPEIRYQIASQGTDGLVSVQYQVKDTDTASGTYAGNVYITLEYCAASSTADCPDTGTANWSQASSVTGSTGTTTVPMDGSYLATTIITWNPKIDFNNKYYNATYKVRLKANDLEAANNLGYGVVSSMTLDTTNPSPGAIPLIISATSSPANLTLSCTDNSALFMRIGTSSDLSSLSWQNYNSTSTIDISSFSPATTTVYVQFKDYYNNTTTVQSATTPETPSAMMAQDTTNMNISPPEYRLFLAWQVVNLPSPGFNYYSIQKSTDNISFSQIATSSRLINYYTDQASLSSTTVYYYKVATVDLNNNVSFYSQVISAKANGTQDYGEGGGGTPSSPPTISSVVATSTYTTQATINWHTDKLSDSRVYYQTSTGGDFSLAPMTGIASMVDKPISEGGSMGQHSVTLTGLAPNTTYYYMVGSTDAYSNTATSTLAPNGYLFSTLSGPIISTSSPMETNITNTSATINWTTDQNANSYVYYATSTLILASSPSLAGQADSATTHSVNLTGLTPNTTYYYYLKSGLAQDTNQNNYYQFTTTFDNTAPTISSVASSTTRTTATITWQTNEDATSRVDYGLTTSYGSIASSSTTTKIHAISLTNLTPNTLYHFKVNSIDNNNNSATSSDYTFTTETFSLYDVSASTAGTSTITITWQTNESANSQVEYSTNSNLTSSTLYPANPTNASTSHSVILTGLSQKTTYYYRASSTSGLESKQSPIYHFTTGDTTAPTISNATSTLMTDISAVITWNTDEEANSEVDYGLVSGSYTLEASSSTSTKIHSITLSSLTANTTYYYRLTSSDGNSNTSTSTEYSFITRETLYTQTEKEAAEAAARSSSQTSGGGLQVIDKTDKAGPTIFKIEIASVKSDSATVSWVTNEVSNSYVEFGATQSYGDVDGIWDSVLEHSVKIKNLLPSTSYHYRILSADSSGNLAQSPDQTFTTLSLSEELNQNLETPEIPTTTPETEERQKETSNLLIEVVAKTLDFMKRMAKEVSLGTLQNVMSDQQRTLEDLANFIPPPLMSGEPKVEIGATTVTIFWTTDKEANSLVAMASANQYDIKKEDPYVQVVGKPYESATNHKVTLQGLTPDTLYHYQLRSKSNVGQEARSSDFTFKTKKEALTIESHQVKHISSSKVIFSWVTNLETDSEIKYIPYRGNTLSIDQAKNKYAKAVTTIHEITVDDLEAGTIYQIEMSGEDPKGNKTSKVLQAFSTEKDSLPPQIYQVQTDLALSPGKSPRVQAIISWMTDEPATSRIYFQKGFGNATTNPDDTSQMEKTNLDANYTKKHVMVITKFEPGSIYTFKVESTDSSNNTAISKTFSVLAPRRTETVFEIIIKNFEQIFGWVSFVGK